MSAARRANLGFGLRTAGVWTVMVLMLVVVPDTLEQWGMDLNVARVCGWVLASGIWVAVLERDWQKRFSPPARFALQIVAWLGAALTAIWISEQFRFRVP